MQFDWSKVTASNPVTRHLVNIPHKGEYVAYLDKNDKLVALDHEAGYVWIRKDFRI